MSLTDKQQAFVEHYLVTLNASEAAREAGYSKKTAGQIGHELLDKPDIQAALKTAIQARSERTQITSDQVLKDIAEIKRRCMQGEPVLDVKGVPTGEWKFEAKSALKACELEGMHLGMWKSPPTKHEGQIEVIIKNYTDAD